MERLCPECLDITMCQQVTRQKEVQIEDETIRFEAKVLFCTECESIIPDSEFQQQNYVTMYNEYRKRKGFLFPEEIAYLRKEVYGLSQRTLATLLGLGHATLSRYESGALQSKQHDNQLCGLKDLEYMQFLFAKNKVLLSAKEAKHLEERLTTLIKAKQSMRILQGFDDAVPLLQVGENIDWSTTSVEEVENYFIIRGQTDDEDESGISPLKLQKLLYYSQGWSLAYTGQQLFAEDFQAWQHGPVIPETYARYKDYRYQRIDQAKKMSLDSLKLTAHQVQVLDWVWSGYGKYEAKYLEHLTHQELPWSKARGSLPSESKSTALIPKQDIEEFFCSLLANFNMLRNISL